MAEDVVIDENASLELPATNDLLSIYNFSMNIVLTIAIGVLTTILVVYYVFSRKVKVEVAIKTKASEPTMPRFRKRDKVLFYGRKMLRKVRSFAKHTMHDVSATASYQKKKKLMVLRLAKRFMHFRKDQTPTLLRQEPPPSLLEVDFPEGEFETKLPAEVMYMLRSVRVLGHFEKPIFLELCKFMESKYLTTGERLFNLGDADDSIYVVQSGKLQVVVSDPDGTEQSIKEVSAGESIHSLLSILDVLTGHLACYKTVSAIAIHDSTILRLPAKAFKDVLERFPESLVRVVQVIMVRLQRVTFMALHNYLGLSYELINPENQSDKSYSVHSIGLSPNGSPVKLQKKSTAEEEEDVLDVFYESKPSKNIIRHLCEEPRRKVSNSGIGKRSDARNRGSAGNSGNSLSSHPVGSVSARTDFDAAVSQARVGQHQDHLGGTPPSLNTWFFPDEQSSSSHQPLGTPRRIRKSHNSGGAAHTVVIDDNRPHMDMTEVLQLATKDIVKLFGLKNENLLRGKVILRYVTAGTEMVKQGDQDANLIFVVTGSLQVLQQVIGGHSSEQHTTLFGVYPGEIVGSLAVLTGEPSFFSIRARTDARVATISKTDFYSIMKEQPEIVLNIAHRDVKRMSPFVRQIDFALDWMQVEAGRALFRQGEESDSIFIILNGRLRSVLQQPDGKKDLIGEYGRGEIVGLVEVLTQSDRATTVMAVRDTELAVIPEELLTMIKRKYPQIVTRLIHLLGKRLLGSLTNKPSVKPSLSENTALHFRPTVANLATIAILPASDDVPLSNFTMELQHALSVIGETLKLTSEVILQKLGGAAFDSVNEYRLSSWLGQQEDIHRMVLYQCDYRMTPWTQRCVRQSDCILIVARAENGAAVGKLEKQVDNLAVRAQKELILLHREDARTPRGTAEWLNLRGWVSSHHHIRCPKRIFSKKPQQQMIDLYAKLAETEPDKMSDFSRLARSLTGTSIGLVLGGGGARGASHIGMIKAMQESGIPIDIVGGTSIGAFSGALWAESQNVTLVTQRFREWAVRDMNSLWNKILDLTYPVTAMFSGSAFNRSIETVFRGRQIEDLWIPFFCVTTDISSSRQRVHTTGSLWRYVRASMSLSGYLPPLCDPVDGHLLLDGGYVNNLPADVMKTMGAQSIFAVDVGSQDENDLTNYGDELSGWWLLWKRWNPWAAPIKVPNMAEIQSRLAYVSCVQQLESVKNNEYCEYIRPPIDRYRTLQFGHFDEICDIGFHHGTAVFQTWRKTDLYRALFREHSSNKLKREDAVKTTVPRQANFTDLAELISRIEEPRSHFSDTVDFYISDDEMDGKFYNYDSDKALSEPEDLDQISIASEPADRDLDIEEDGLLMQRPRAHSEGETPNESPPNDMSPIGTDDEDNSEKPSGPLKAHHRKISRAQLIQAVLDEAEAEINENSGSRKISKVEILKEFLRDSDESSH